jgi:hypothetical protein
MRPLSVALTRRGLGESSVRRFRDLLSAFFAKGLVSRRLRLVELRGLEPLTFSLRRLRPVHGTTLDAVADGASRA